MILGPFEYFSEKTLLENQRGGGVLNQIPD